MKYSITYKSSCELPTHTEIESFRLEANDLIELLAVLASRLHAQVGRNEGALPLDQARVLTFHGELAHE